jgi:hypothetical protein
MRVQRMLMLVGLMAGALAVQGCDPNMDTDDGFADNKPEIHLTTSDRSMVTGEVITVAAKTSNVIGKDAEIEWEAPGGRIDVQDDGQIARVRFDEPGTKEIAANLFVDGKLLRRDAVTVQVRPLR